MKKPGLFLPLLFAALLGSCNPDVFIDSCAPATDQLQVPADGTAATLRFGSGNWYVRGLFLKKQDLYEEIRGDIYDADGTQLYFDVPFHFSDLGRAKYVASYPQFSLTLERTAARGLPVGGHVILGLPGESREDMLGQAADISRLPLDTLKLHQLQLIRGTRMAREYEERPEDFHLFDDVDEYIALVVDYIQRLRPDLVLERFVSQAPKELLIAPDWGLKNYEFNHRLQKRMKELDAWQGKLYNQ